NSRLFRLPGAEAATWTNPLVRSPGVTRGKRRHAHCSAPIDAGTKRLRRADAVSSGRAEISILATNGLGALDRVKARPDLLAKSRGGRPRQRSRPGIAAIERLKRHGGTAPRGGPAQEAFENRARGHVETVDPPAKSGTEPARQAFLLTEVDDLQGAADRKQLRSVFERPRPGRNHRQAVGKENAVEVRPREQAARVEIGGIALGEHDPPGKARPLDM